MSVIFQRLLVMLLIFQTWLWSFNLRRKY